MNVEFSNERPCSEIQKEKADLENENKALKNQVKQLTDEKAVLEEKNKNVMLAVTELYEMFLPFLPPEGGTS
ncbi:hypothetical protein ACFYU8_29780 [Brevibacillus sp. NPDC003359]|uniref:hypothetical protein n=1 Tax=unclassified Brevibacillus TaxID=2684853 RepID=UPI0036D01A32